MGVQVASRLSRLMQREQVLGERSVPFTSEALGLGLELSMERLSFWVASEPLASGRVLWAPTPSDLEIKRDLSSWKNEKAQRPGGDRACVSMAGGRWLHKPQASCLGTFHHIWRKGDHAQNISLERTRPRSLSRSSSVQPPKERGPRAQPCRRRRRPSGRTGFLCGKGAGRMTNKAPVPEAAQWPHRSGDV